MFLGEVGALRLELKEGESVFEEEKCHQESNFLSSNTSQVHGSDGGKAFVECEYGIRSINNTMDHE